MSGPQCKERAFEGDKGPTEPSGGDSRGKGRRLATGHTPLARQEGSRLGPPCLRGGVRRESDPQGGVGSVYLQTARSKEKGSCFPSSVQVSYSFEGHFPLGEVGCK